MRRYILLALLVALVGTPSAVFAADADVPVAQSVSRPALVLPTGQALVAASANTDGQVAPFASLQTKARGFDGRRPLLTALHGMTGLLQAYDGMSTARALNAGAHEANPLMKGAVGDPRVLVATKVGATFMSVLASEKLYRSNHRTAAVLVSVLTNSAMLAVASHNSQVLNRLQVQ